MALIVHLSSIFDIATGNRVDITKKQVYGGAVVVFDRSQTIPKNHVSLVCKRRYKLGDSIMGGVLSPHLIYICVPNIW
jgi:hypothetical protein